MLFLIESEVCILRSDLSFNYEYNTSGSRYPFLLHANRMGEGLVAQTFSIQRNSSYPFFTIHILLEGHIFFQVARQDYRLATGDAFLINAGEEHLYRNFSVEPLRLLWIEFPISACPEIFQYLRHHPAPILNAGLTEELRDALQHIIDVLRSNPAADETMLSELYYQFLMKLLKAVSSQPSLKQPEPVQEALNYITLHFREPVSVQELADRLHISRAYLTRTFSRHVGISPVRYIQMRRLEYACRLLTDSDMTCEEIALETGMYDASHFNRLFQQNIGCSPSEYRRWAENKILYTL